MQRDAACASESETRLRATAAAAQLDVKIKQVLTLCILLHCGAEPQRLRRLGGRCASWLNGGGSHRSRCYGNAPQRCARRSGFYGMDGMAILCGLDGVLTAFGLLRLACCLLYAARCILLHAAYSTIVARCMLDVNVVRSMLHLAWPVVSDGKRWQGRARGGAAARASRNQRSSNAFGALPCVWLPYTVVECTGSSER